MFELVAQSTPGAAIPAMWTEAWPALPYPGIQATMMEASWQLERFLEDLDAFKNMPEWLAS